MNEFNGRIFQLNNIQWDELSGGMIKDANLAHFQYLLSIIYASPQLVYVSNEGGICSRVVDDLYGFDTKKRPRCSLDQCCFGVFGEAKAASMMA